MEGEKVCGIFNLHGVRYQNQVKINHRENITLKEHEYVSDTLVKEFDIMKHVKGAIYLCNITHIFLMSTKKLPMLYVSVIHERPMRNILLFRIYLCFTIESEIKNPKELLNTPLNGKFNFEIIMNTTRKEMNDKIDKYIGDERMFDKLTNFVNAPEMKEFIETLIEEIDIKLTNEYKEEFEYLKPPTNVISLKNYKLD